MEAAGPQGAQGGPDAIVGLRDLLDKSKKQKEAAAEQEKEALLNGLAQLAAAQHLQESRIAAQEEQITALKAQIYKGVDFQVKAVEERINAKLPELTQKIEQRLDKVESSLGESFHAIETLISSLSAGKRKARDLLVAQAVTAFSHVSVHMTDEQRVTLVQKRVRGFLRRKRIAAREDATARALAELAAFKERVEGEKQRLYYDYKKLLLRRGSSKSTRGSATSARSAPVQGSPRLAHPRSSSSSAPAEVMPSLDERRPSLFTASDDSDEAATTRAATAGEEGGAN